MPTSIYIAYFISFQQEMINDQPCMHEKLQLLSCKVVFSDIYIKFFIWKHPNLKSIFFNKFY